MHRQASFYAANWPEGTKVAEDGDVFAFYLPPTNDDNGKPVLGGGEFIAAFSDQPEVQAFQTYLSTDTWANEKAKATPNGGWVSANKGLDIDQPGQPDRQALGRRSCRTRTRCSASTAPTRCRLRSARTPSGRR